MELEDIGTIFKKMQYDVWCNIIILNNECWFLSDEIKTFDSVGGKTFVEFKFSETDLDFFTNHLKKEKCLNLIDCKRNISVRLEEIACIIETDS